MHPGLIHSLQSKHTKDLVLDMRKSLKDHWEPTINKDIKPSPTVVTSASMGGVDTIQED